MKNENIRVLINNALQKITQGQYEFAILLVVNMQNEYVENDYAKYSVTTSYYSDIELEEIVQGFKSFANYIDISYGEKEFINKISSGYFEKFKKFKKIVYTQTASGTGRSKSALIPALCERYNLMYCSNDIFTSALLDNKLASLRIFRDCGIPTPETWVYHHRLSWLEDAPPPGKLLICKSSYECASIGVSADSVSELNSAYQDHLHSLSLLLRQPVLVQEFIEGFEVEVPVLFIDCPVVLPVCGISLEGKEKIGDKILTYDTIFEDGFNLFNFDEFSPVLAQNLKDLSQRAYSLLQFWGPVRLDYRVSENGNPFLMDYNNSPHLGTQHSFANAMKYLGLSYEDLLKIIAYPAIVRDNLYE